MKTVRIIILIMLIITAVLISLQITVPIFSTANLNRFFGIVMCGAILGGAFSFLGRLKRVDKSQYPKKGQIVWLFICFGSMCLMLVGLAYSNEIQQAILSYVLFLSYAGMVGMLIDDIEKQTGKEKADNETEKEE